jgi:RHS repeat-associated protein
VGGVQSGYSDDGDQQRVIRTGPGGATYSIRGAGSQVLAEYEAGGGGAVLVREYIYLGAKLLASIGRPAGAAPTVAVALTSPSPGATVTQGTTVTLTAQPTVSAGSVARVEFYTNGWYLGQDTAAPYTLDYPGFIPADHGLVARVVTTTGVVASSGVVVITVTPPNGAPAVSLTAPAPNAVLGTGRTATLAATATDSDGIAQVEFYRGTVLVGTDTSAPYSVDWTDLPTGTYTLTAKASDIHGATTTSAPVTLTVRPIATITVSPASPTAGTSALVTVDGAAFCTGVTVDFGDGHVETFVNGNGLPITGTHAWASAGTRTLTATGLGAACESQAATTAGVLVPPAVTLTSPAEGSTYTALATIEIAATAAPGQGSMASVAFYWNGNHLTTDTTAPYAYTWQGVNSGTFSLTAVATDTAGAVATSSSVSVTVGDPPPSTVLTVVVTPNPVAAGQSATVTVSGTNPCTMLWMDFGDGDWWIAPIGGLPFQTTKTWSTPGNYLVYAAGSVSCSGEALRWVTVNPSAPAPLPLTALAIPDGSPSLWDQPFGLGEGLSRLSSSAEPWRAPDEVADGVAVADTSPAPHPATELRGRSDALPDVTVYLDITGTGSGTVSGSASCTGASVSCAVVTPQSSVLTLTAAPHAGMTFTGWTGACWHATATCTVEAWEHRFVAATFTAATAMVTSYYHLDTVGSVRALTDAAGTVTERHDYRPFGEDTLPLPAPGADPARFLGQPRDSTALDQFGARYYSMFHGRFTSVDPVISPSAMVRPQKWNRYAYARNNPLRFVDPMGLDDDPPPSLEPDPGPSPYYLEGNAEWDQLMEEDWLRQRAQYLFEQQSSTGGGSNPQVMTLEQFRVEPHTLEQLVGDIADRSGNTVEFLANGLALVTALNPVGVVSATLAGAALGLANDCKTCAGLAMVPRLGIFGDSAGLFSIRGYTYGARVFTRAAEDPRFHNFPLLIDDVVLGTAKTNRISDTYHLYELAGSYGKTTGRYQIGVNPQTREITHRFFKPDKR